MDQNIIHGIEDIEKSIGKLSSAQKILLTTDGSVTAILDVIKGHVHLETLVQKFQDADKDVAELLDIDEGDTVNYRVVVMGTEEPLIHAVSYIPVERLENNFKEDLIKADIPIGRILKNHKIESRREIKTIYAERTNKETQEIYGTDSPMLARTYNIIHNGEVLIWIKETFPYDLFRD
ncbi:chorismate--pyruvate lyase family protein [Methanobacterium aggregans]|uniref:chorismate--pyruvate lyase family protein n=1 Tax=Methanobacterium aggregans TaxID=1615586 RepID=UPI001AEA0219|nr:chorismate lyase [Methanobacterium aggregans]MBP2045428.1 chorismate-pyruvate lyase [Methanobacterium aggregans]